VQPHERLVVFVFAAARLWLRWRPGDKPKEGAMMRLAAVTGLVMLSASAASAMCVENRSDRNIAFVRGAPFAEMSVLFQDIVPPRGFKCAPMPTRADGVTPVSIYTVDARGRCLNAAGCFYENGDAQNVFVGAGAKGCVTPFKVDYCPSKK
jgi:hypothetical protein